MDTGSAASGGGGPGLFGRGLGDAEVPPGSVESAGPAGIDVVCGAGVLRLSELQRSGGKRLGASDFLRGMPVRPGVRFGIPA